MLRRPAALFLLKLGLAGLALGLLVRTTSPEALRSVLLHAHPGWALAALALLPLNVTLEAYRWHRLVARVAPETSFGASLRAVVGGYPMGLLTPARVGDYVGRALYLRTVSPGVSAALTFAERMATLACCLVFGLVALVPFAAEHLPRAPLWPALAGLSAAATAALLAGLLYPQAAQAALSLALPFRRARRTLVVFRRFATADTAVLLALSAVRYAVFTAQFVLLVRALAPEAAWLPATTAVALVFFVKSAVPQVTLGDLGIRESAAVFFLSAYGVAEAAALHASLGVFVINLLLPALAGVPLMLHLRLGSAVAEPAARRAAHPAPAGA
ncbi:MAG: lysylphosphatidylglycerol synthase transmembrane domain-containing protein [Rubricoccaceae bacterium]